MVPKIEFPNKQCLEPPITSSFHGRFTSHHRRLAAVDLLLLSCPEVNCIFQLLAVFRSAQNIKATCIISQLLGLGSKTSLKPLNSIG